MKIEQINIFLIEDNYIMVKYITEAINLNFKNANVINFNSVEKALGNISQKPNYIILDHFLEKTNGIDCIPLFKEFVPTAKIIVLSSQNDIKVFEKAFIYGASDYFRKDSLSIKNIIDFLIKDIEGNKENWYSSLTKMFKSNKKRDDAEKLIYILDDNHTTSFSISHQLKQNSRNIIESFTNIKDFLCGLNNRIPDYVVLDYNLDNNTTCEDTLLQIKGKSQETNVIVFSGKTDVNTAVDLMRLGANFYFTKSKENLLYLKGLIN